MMLKRASVESEERRKTYELLKKYFGDVEIEKAMFDVVSGPLGKKIWIPYKVSEHYEYNDGSVFKDIYFKEYNANFDEPTLARLRQVYEKHIAYKEKYDPITVDYTKYHEVREIFDLIYPQDYVDDKIIIDNIKFEYYKEETCDGYMLKSGTIKLLDGTILMDIGKDIYRPGNWVDYVCYLINVLKNKKVYEDGLRKKAYEQHQLQKKLERKRIYDINHSSIDDSKYFR